MADDDREVRITANYPVVGDDYVELLADARATAYRLLGEGRTAYWLNLYDATLETVGLGDGRTLVTRWKAMAHLAYPDAPEF